MANVTTRTANWRLFGGGGLLVGGLLWTLHLVLVQVGILGLGQWLFVVALIVVAVALVFVALGETGSNGAVGSYVYGKVALIVYAAGFLLLAVNAAAGLGRVASTIALILLTIGGLTSAFFINRKGVAKGAARWALFVPAVVGELWAVNVIAPELVTGWLLGLEFAILIAITGALYLFNDRKLG